MAKKRKTKEEKKDEIDFEFPEFDEKEFMRNEIQNTKAIFLAFGYALLILVPTYFAGRYVSIAVAFLIGLLGIGGLKFIFDAIDLDLEQFGKKEWAGSIAVYFFTWLAFWILVSNPPFSDFAAPEISVVSDSVQEAQVVDAGNVTLDPVAIELKIVDNYRIEEATLTITDAPAAFGTTGGEHRLEEADDNNNIYRYQTERWVLGTYQYAVAAVDSYGNTEEMQGSLEIVNASPPVVTTDYTGREPVIKVWVEENGKLDRVWYYDNSTKKEEELKFVETVANTYKAEIDTETWEGQHILTIYAEDTAGNRDTVTFTWPTT